MIRVINLIKMIFNTLFSGARVTTQLVVVPAANNLQISAISAKHSLLQRAMHLAPFVWTMIRVIIVIIVIKND